VIGREHATYRVRAVERPGPLAPGTLVLLTTKVNANAAAAAALLPLVRDDTTVLCVQNGLGGDDIVRDGLQGRCLVLRAVTQFGAIHESPGCIDFKVAGYTLVEDSRLSAAIASLLTAAGLDGRVSPTIATEVWRKLIANCVINPITSICGTDVGSIANPMLDPLKLLVIDECLRVAAAEGVSFDGMTPAEFNQRITEVFGASRNTASMRQDLLRGKPTEIDHMNGAVVELGKKYGIATPVNAAMTTMIRYLEHRS